MGAGGTGNSAVRAAARPRPAAAARVQEWCATRLQVSSLSCAVSRQVPGAARALPCPAPAVQFARHRPRRTRCPVLRPRSLIRVIGPPLMNPPLVANTSPAGIRMQGVADEHLVRVRLVSISRIDERDTSFHHAPEQRDAAITVRILSSHPGTGQAHCAVTKAVRGELDRAYLFGARGGQSQTSYSERDIGCSGACRSE